MNLSFPRAALIVMHKCLKNSASRRLYCSGSASFACACRRSLHSSYRQAPGHNDERAERV